MRTLVDDKAEVVRSGMQSIQLHVTRERKQTVCKAHSAMSRVPARDTPQRECRTLTLRDEPGEHHAAPVDARLRRCLKAMLRSYGIRCVSIGPAPRREQGQQGQEQEGQE